ncbi:MAG TPA: BON domain-containing protein [Candidatus Acidoferrum sp.]|jgi:hyperosmotically inducible periplasmic protein|nr:BON domain-containing protein [Candidatus Acidoferrum sp.]
MKRGMKGFRLFTLTVCAIALSGAITLVTSGVVFGQDPQQPDSYNNASGVPAEKPAKATPTAADRDMTQKIRKAIAADKSISTEGRRVKIATQGGKVTLAGSAKSEAERTSIFTKAADVAGGTNVVNNITVAAQK